jgi:FG-GAP-like repeat
MIARNDGGTTFVDQPPLLVTQPGADPDAYPDRPSIVRMAWGDPDDNGLPDVALAVFGRPFAFYVNEGGGSLVQTAWAGPDFGGGAEWCNLDGDPEPELAIAGYSYIYIVDNVSGRPSDTLVPYGFEAASDIHCGDLDGDGDGDLFASGDDGAPARALRNADGDIHHFAEAWRDTTTAAGTTHQWNAALGDLDGDGKLDAIGAGNAYDGPLRFQVYPNTSTGGQDIQFDVPAETQLAGEAQLTRDIAVAPLIGN